MKLNKHELYHKEFIKAEKRYNTLRNKLFSLPFVKLDIPVQRGWQVHLVLREDVLRRKDAPILQEALNLGFYDGLIIRAVSTVRAIRKGETYIPYTSWDGTTTKTSLYPRRKRYTKAQYEKLPSHLKKFFTSELVTLEKTKQATFYYINLPTYMLKLKVKPNIHTHARVGGGELESELIKLRDFLYTGKHPHYREHHYRDRSERKVAKINLKKFIKGEVDF